MFKSGDTGGSRLCSLGFLSHSRGTGQSQGLRLDTSNVFYYLSSVKDVLRVPFTSCEEHHAINEARCPVLEARFQYLSLGAST